MDTICFDKTAFYTYLFILVFLVSLFVYANYWNYTNENMYLQIKNQLINEINKNDKPDISTNIPNIPNIPKDDIQLKFLEKIINPLSGTSTTYPGGSFSSPPYDGYRQFQMLGYINGPNGRYPVMGRYKYSGKTDKFEYYSIDNERGRIKIPFKNTNDNELYDNDSIVIPELGQFTFKKYENTDNNRYDPNVI